MKERGREGEVGEGETAWEKRMNERDRSEEGCMCDGV